MADTKISALTAASSAALANEFAINEAGVSKKVSGTQLKALLNPFTVTVLSADLASTSSTLAKVTGLDTALAAGLWEFRYYIGYRSDTSTVGVKYSVNFTGTQTIFLLFAEEQEGTTAASTGAADQQHATFGLRAGGSQRAPSTTVAAIGTISVDTINADMLIVIKGIIRVTVSGNIELYHANETGTTQIKTMADSVLILNKLA